LLWRCSSPCSRTDARGNITSYSYDPLSRLTGKSYTVAGNTAPTPNVTLTYDQTTDPYGIGTGSGIGRLTSEQVGAGTTSWLESFHYDPMGRIGEFRQQWGDTPDAPYGAYGYDWAGNVVISNNGIAL
jgi:YD repeat-containing protein